jgi:multidrug efflux pump subunit AcrA (membrane-fusion protein)
MTRPACQACHVTNPADAQATVCRRRKTLGGPPLISTQAHTRGVGTTTPAGASGAPHAPWYGKDEIVSMSQTTDTREIVRVLRTIELRSSRMRRRRRRVTLGGAGVAAVTALSVAAAQLAGAGQTAAAPAVDVSGHLEAAQQTDLDFGTTGQVVTVMVRPGQAVAPGTVLASLDTAGLEATLSQATSVLTAAQQKLSADQAANPGAQAQAAALGTIDAANAQVSAAGVNLGDTQRIGDSTLLGAQLGLAAGTDVLAAAQAQVNAAQKNVNDTQSVNQAAVAGAGQALDSATSAAQAAVDTAQAQVDAATRAQSDATQVGQATVAAAQQVVTTDTARVAADTSRLSADQATQASDCTAGPTSQVCASDRQIVNSDQQTLSNDQATLAKDQGALGQATATATQSSDQARSAVTAAQVVLGNARSARSSTTGVAQNVVDQLAAKASENGNQAEGVLQLARVALQAARDATGPAARSLLDQARARAQQGIDQAQVGLLTSQVALHSAQRSLEALHAPPAVQLILTDRSQVEAAQAQTALSRHNLDNATLVAPLHGVVEQVNIATGQQVNPLQVDGQQTGTAQQAATTSSTAPPTAATAVTHAIVLETPDSFHLTGSVKEADVVKFRLGDRVTVTLPAVPGSYQGTITDIAPAGTIRGNLVSFGVTATFEAPNANLRTGMTARMRFLPPPGH